MIWKSIEWTSNMPTSSKPTIPFSSVIVLSATATSVDYHPASRRKLQEKEGYSKLIVQKILKSKLCSANEYNVSVKTFL